MSVLVVGSINEDIVLRTERLPAAGETLRASDLARYPGGKGANQAVAAARLGARTALVGRVGSDDAGSRLVEALAGAGVDTARITVGHPPTGTALITVGADGSNTIVTVGGANHEVGAAEMKAFEEALDGTDVVLVQLEIPMHVVEAVVAMTRARGVAVVLDPAPVSELSARVLGDLTWITPNEHEAAVLTGHQDPAEAARALRSSGVQHVVVTMGARGALYLGAGGPDRATFVIAPRVDVLDTVACGDAFNGCLAVSLAHGAEPIAAVRRACAAGSAAARVAGAYPSLPFAAVVDRLHDATSPPRFVGLGYI